MNKVILLGRLTADPELRQTQSGISACRFTVAVNRRFKDKQTGDYTADFINCQAWRQTAEFITKYFRKGDSIALEGTLQNNNYEKDGVKYYSYIVSAENAEFGGSKKETAQQTDYGSYEAPQQQSTPQQPTQNNDSMSYGSLSEFEEILSDGDVPF